jgi:hypothetical protein
MRFLAYPCCAEFVAQACLAGRQVRNQNLIDEIPLENGCLWAAVKASSCRTHGIPLVQGLILTRTTGNFHFRLVQNITTLTRVVVTCGIVVAYASCRWPAESESAGQDGRESTNKAAQAASAAAAEASKKVEAAERGAKEAAESASRIRRRQRASAAAGPQAAVQAERPDATAKAKGALGVPFGTRSKRLSEK